MEKFVAWREEEEKAEAAKWYTRKLLFCSVLVTFLLLLGITDIPYSRTILQTLSAGGKVMLRNDTNHNISPNRHTEKKHRVLRYP